MKLLRFIGRKKELQSLRALLKKKSASLVVVQGRRRIGKSRLIEEFAKDFKFYHFMGLPPTEKTTKQSQLDEFSRQLSLQTGLPEVTTDDWSKLFLLLSEKTKKGRLVILFDEITWMGSKDPDFLGKLKNAWDLYFKKNPELIFILCGSISVWIEENILSSTGFLGRISYRLDLEELPLFDCAKFWDGVGSIISPYEKLKVLSVTGGVPRYLEEIKPTLSAEENIKDLCFSKGGVLVNEFDDVFSDLFSQRSLTYRNIIKTLSSGVLDIKHICEENNLTQTGFMTKCLDDLIKSGFITRDYTWNIKSNEVSRLSHFRLSDNYIRFYLKYIEKNKLRINNGDYHLKSLSLLPNWDGIMGLQFENLVLKNRDLIKRYLQIKPDDILSDNPYFQRTTARQTGCQIDYLIQTKFQILYLCEIKFKKTALGSDIIREVDDKIKSLQIPKGFSLRPVLIHVNGVQEEVLDSGYFSDIIDFGIFFEEP
jgi:AAA+ ATPase superfamily predicted ATPase